MLGASVLRAPLGRWGVLKTPLTSRNAALLGEYPQVKRGSTHSRSEAMSARLLSATARLRCSTVPRSPPTFKIGGRW
jgi:hypothetical protein